MSEGLETLAILHAEAEPTSTGRRTGFSVSANALPRA
jgi:hypothetical protein